MSIKFYLEYFLHNISHNSNMNCKKRIILISLSHCDHQIGIYIEKTKKDKPCFAKKYNFAAENNISTLIS